MFRIISDKKLKKRDNKFFQEGIQIGFKFGIEYMKALQNESGIIFGEAGPPKYQREIEEIARNKEA